MSIRIITADQRMARTGIRVQIWGSPKIGKTSLLWTLPAERTLVLDFEAGLLAVQGHPVDSIPVRSWPDARDLACWIGGPNPAMRPDQPYSEAHYEHCCEQIGDPADLARFDTIFIDSTTVAGQLCLQWAQGQPEAFSDRNNKPDTRGAYGLLKRELIAWATQLHHIPGKDVFLVGGLVEETDDFGRKSWAPLIDGKAKDTLPFIFDEIITMAEIKGEEGSYRALVCHKINPWNFPAGDRSGRLDMLEEPHLGKLVAKLRGPVRPASERLTYTKPQAAE